MWLENFPLVVQRVLFLKTNNFVLVNSVNSRQILLFAIRDSLEFPAWHFYFFQLQLLIAVAWSVWKWYLIWSMSIVLSPFAVRNSDIRSTPTHLGILDHATIEILDQRFYSLFSTWKIFLDRFKQVVSKCVLRTPRACAYWNQFFWFTETIRMHVPVVSDQFVLNRQGLEILNLPRQTQIKLFVRPIHSSFDCIVLIDFLFLFYCYKHIPTGV